MVTRAEKRPDTLQGVSTNTEARKRQPIEDAPFVMDELDLLPEDTQAELREIRRIAFAEFDEVRWGATQPWKKAGRILKLVALGADCEPVGNLSEPWRWTLVIVVNDSRFADFETYWSPLKQRLDRERLITKSLRATVEIAAHSLTEMNGHIRDGAGPFVRLLEKGIRLYDDGATHFVHPGCGDQDSARVIRQTHCDYWFPLIGSAQTLVGECLSRGMWRDAAFLLHQGFERSYHCALLVRTLHSPKTHRIEALRGLAEAAVPSLKFAWIESGEAENRFNRLSRAYNSARYDQRFRMRDGDLEWLHERLGRLQELVRIETVIQCLPDDLRQAFLLSRDDDLNAGEIAARMAITQDAVEGLLDSAFTLVTETLGQVKYHRTQ